MACVTIAIARRASDSKAFHQLLNLTNDRVQASVATLPELKLLHIIITLAIVLSQHLMGFRVLYKSPSLKVHCMNRARHIRIQMQETMPSMVRSAVAPTVPCLELLRQMATALGAFWKAQYHSHTHIQFQVK